MNEKRLIHIAIAQEQSERWDIIDVQHNKDAIARALKESGFRPKILPVRRDDFSPVSGLEKKIIAARAPLIFNLFEGFSDAPQYEGEFIQVLENLGIRYTGNPSVALRLCLDKEQTLRALAGRGIPVPRAYVVRDCGEQTLQKIGTLDFPVFIKPRAEDASVGVDEQSLVRRREQLPAVLAAKLKEAPAGVMVEEFIPGMEYVVGLLGPYPYEDLGIFSVDFSRFPEFPPFLTYRSKWDCGADEFKKVISVPTGLDERKAARIMDIARAAGATLQCEGYFRVDLRERGEEVFVLDVNPNPDLNTACGFARQAYNRGYAYRDLIAKIVDYARATGNGSRDARVG